MKKAVIILILAAAPLAKAAPELWTAQWITQLDEVAFYPDGRVGCVLGKQQGSISLDVVFRCTFDGGVSWKNIFEESSAWGGKILLSADGVHGWVLLSDEFAGKGQTLLRTQDGSRTWASLHLPQDGGESRDSIQFAPDAQHGIVGGGLFGKDLRTDDGGETWSPISFEHDTGPFHTVVLEPNGKDAVAEYSNDLGHSSQFLISSDSGVTWRPPKPGERIPPIRAAGKVDFKWDRASNSVQRTVNGTLWQTVSHLDPKLNPENFFSRDGREVWLCGSHFLLLHSGDGGSTWNPIYQPPEWSEVSFHAAHTGSNGSKFWAAGDGGFVVRTTDGGVTWSGVRTSPNKPALHAMYLLPDDLHGWVAAEGAIFRTDDGGDTWQPSEFAFGIETPDLYAISFDAAGETGWSGGVNNTLLLTEDGGAHWRRAAVEAKDPSGRIHVIIPLNNSRVLAFSGSEALLSQDNGASWRPITENDHLSGVPDHASAGAFSSGFANGCVAALQSLSCSHDGGATWNKAILRAFETGRPKEVTFSGDVEMDMDPSGRTAIAHQNNFMWLRSADGGQHWFSISGFLPDCKCALAISEDGTVWGAGNYGVFFRLTEDALDGPAISTFEIGDDLKPRIQAAGSALKGSGGGEFKSEGPLRGYIAVRGRGIEFLNGQDERAFTLDKVSQVKEWNRSIFHDNEDYFFDLFVSDGWNIASASATKRFSSSVSALTSRTEIDTADFDFTGTSAVIDDIDGKPLSSEVVTRGPPGQPGSISKRVADAADVGIHEITVAGQRALLYKDKTSLSLFHPFDHSYAVIVAVGDYPASSQFRKLRAAVDQAKKLKIELEQSGFEVFDPLYDAQATKSNIENLLTDKVLKKVTTRDRLLIYLSGHGADRRGADGKPLGYYIPVDGRLDNLDATAINLVDIQKYARVLPAKHILFALDSCQSGFAIRTSPTLPLAELKEFKTVTQITGYTREPTRLVLTAGTGEQKAVDDNGGVFTDKLMEAIRGGAGVDLDNNGVIDQWELCKYLYDTVPAAAKLLAGLTQEPGCQNLDGFGNGKWIFATTPQIRSLLGAK
jgi:photosystem II stability/assembly factor-like uncharacterized protein